MQYLLIVLLALGHSTMTAQVPAAGTQASTQTASGNGNVDLKRGRQSAFRAQVDLVVVPVVVRDDKGHAIGHLTIDDFQLFDKEKLQTISQFSIEKPIGNTPNESGAIEPPRATQVAGAPSEVGPRFVAYVFDDLHLGASDTVSLRAATIRHLKQATRPNDRVAVFTTSGLAMLNFTTDSDQVIDALNRIASKSRPTIAIECPPMTFYMANLIQNANDPTALAAAISDYQFCAFGGAKPGNATTSGLALSAPVRSAVSRTLELGEADLRQTLGTLNDVIRRMSSTPGQRVVVFISPGFIVTPNYSKYEVELIGRAIRSNVTISSLDARGLVGESVQASRTTNPVTAIQENVQYRHESTVAEQDVLVQVAEGSGGAVFLNSNDYSAGLRLTSDVAESVYLLGFSPDDLKADGSFHRVKVTIKPKGLSVQARRGYYAPLPAMAQVERAERKIREALTLRDEVQDFSIALSLVGKTVAEKTTLSARVHIDLKDVPFQITDDRESNALAIVYGLFDTNGNLLETVKQNADMRLKRESFDATVAAGLETSANFDVSPGKYLVRVVVRDSLAEMMSARNGSAEVPRQ